MQQTLHILVIDADQGTRDSFAMILSSVGYHVLTAPSAAYALTLLDGCHVDAVVAELRLPDRSGLEVLREVRQRGSLMPFALITDSGTMDDVIEAMRLGASNFIEKPVFEADLVRAIKNLVGSAPRTAPPLEADDRCEPHAVRRWARAVAPIVDSPIDLRTIHAWARSIAVSPGALRNWCRTADVTPRRSLLLGRLLRAVLRAEHGRHKLENVLDVVDRRTLMSVLRLAGFDSEPLPPHRGDFLARQVLVRDPIAIEELARAVEQRQASRARMRSERHERCG
jgi:CheY-like chemotaxis protein